MCSERVDPLIYKQSLTIVLCNSCELLYRFHNILSTTFAKFKLIGILIKQFTLNVATKIPWSNVQ